MKLLPTAKLTMISGEDRLANPQIPADALFKVIRESEMDHPLYYKSIEDAMHCVNRSIPDVPDHPMVVEIKSIVETAIEGFDIEDEVDRALRDKNYVEEGYDLDNIIDERINDYDMDDKIGDAVGDKINEVLDDRITDALKEVLKRVRLVID